MPKPFPSIDRDNPNPDGLDGMRQQTNAMWAVSIQEAKNRGWYVDADDKVHTTSCDCGRCRQGGGPTSAGEE